jgi:predicted O-methyltransferase YrrM
VTALERPEVRRVLDRLFAERAAQRSRVVSHVARSIVDRVLGREPSLDEEVERLSAHYASVSPRQGRFLYMVARSIRARWIVEFGTSVAISTIYLATAVRDNGGGRVIGSEMNHGKLAAARDNIAAAGLADLVEIREGNALETFVTIDAKIDLLFLDGFPPLYLPLVKLLLPHLRPGAVVIADNIFTHLRLLRPYRQFLRDASNGFQSETLFMRYGVEYSVRMSP